MRRPSAVQVEPYRNVGFAGFAADRCSAFPCAQQLPYLVPVVGNQRAVIRQSGFGEHSAPLFGRAQQDAARTEVFRQFDVGDPVADYVRGLQVVLRIVQVPAEHACARFARGGVVGGHRTVDQLFVETNAFARKGGEHQVVRRVKRLFGKARGAESVLVRGHYQLVTERGDATHRGDRAGHEAQLFERIYLVVHRRLDDQRAVAVDKEYLLGLWHGVFYCGPGPFGLTRFRFRRRAERMVCRDCVPPLFARLFIFPGCFSFAGDVCLSNVSRGNPARPIGEMHGVRQAVYSWAITSSSRVFSSGVPMVMRRQPSHPCMRERSRTIIPAAISRS